MSLHLCGGSNQACSKMLEGLLAFSASEYSVALLSTRVGFDSQWLVGV
jgi:hypothetical protein